MRRRFWLFVLPVGACFAQANLTLQVSSETVPSGETAHIKVFASRPVALRNGCMTLSFAGGIHASQTPDVKSLTVFSVTGDVSAVSAASGDTAGRLDGWSVCFDSPAAGVGRAPGLPLLEFSIPVLESFTVQASAYVDGVTLTSAPASVIAGGSLSVLRVTRAAQGFEVDGAGFMPGTSVTIDGVPVTSVDVVSPTRILVSLPASAEVLANAKHVRVRNPDGAFVDTWGDAGTSLVIPGATEFLTFPYRAATAGSCARRFPVESNAPVQMVFQNRGGSPAQVSVTNAFPSGTNTVMIPAGGTQTVGIIDPANSQFQASSPVSPICYYRFPYDTNISDVEEWPPSSVEDHSPEIAWVGNAASEAAGPVVPQEIVTLFGTDLEGSGAQLTFDGVPAQLLYVSDTQINAIVPADIAGRAYTTLRLTTAAGISDWTASVGAAAPGVFGILNQDNSLNTVGNGAAPGSVVQMFATGLSAVALPVSVTIGGHRAQILYAGQAPGAVPGLFQVNAVVPGDISAGDLNVVLSAGGAASAPNSLAVN